MTTHGNRKRYLTADVTAALRETDNNTFTPHSQIVLAAEVHALRAALRTIARAVLTADNGNTHGDNGPEGTIMETTELPELMSIADVAAWLRKSVKAVRHMRNRGILPVPIVVPGMRSLRWRRETLLNWWLVAESRSRKTKRTQTNDSTNQRVT